MILIEGAFNSLKAQPLRAVGGGNDGLGACGASEYRFIITSNKRFICPQGFITTYPSSPMTTHNHHRLLLCPIVHARESLEGVSLIIHTSSKRGLQ